MDYAFTSYTGVVYVCILSLLLSSKVFIVNHGEREDVASQ